MLTVNTRVMVGATFHFASPTCDAVTEQRPTASKVTVFPDTLQIVGDPPTNATGNVDDADALTERLRVERLIVGNALKMIVCATFFI